MGMSIGVAMIGKGISHPDEKLGYFAFQVPKSFSSFLLGI
jgi:hypothetical protein